MLLMYIIKNRKSNFSRFCGDLNHILKKETQLSSKLKHINSLKFFASLNDIQLSSVADISSVAKYSKGDILYYENEKFDKVFFLLSGLLKVYIMDKYENEIFLYHIYKNSLISELTTLEHNFIQCFSSAEFTEDSLVLEVDFTKFKTNFLSQNLLNNEFISEILLKTEQLHGVVNRELVFDASAKVAFMLADDLKMFNKLQRQEVSFMLNIQPETLSRVLKKLKRAEIIDMKDLNIIIKNEEALKSIYLGNA